MKIEKIEVSGRTFLGDPHQKNWAREASCRGEGDLLFVRGAQQNKVAQGCGGCLVQAACLRDAIELKEEWGIRGGLTERARRAFVRSVGGYDRVLAEIDHDRNEAISRQIAQNNNPQEYTQLSVPLQLIAHHIMGFDQDTQKAS